MRHPGASRLKPRLGDCEAAPVRSWGLQTPQAFSWWPSLPVRFRSCRAVALATRVPIVACLSLATLSACDAHANDHTTTAATIDTLPGGIVRVRNSGPTMWADSNGWKLVLERTLHPAAGTPGELGQPSAVVASSTGDIFVMEHKPVAIKHYAADGTFLGAIGQEGSGPGEFRDYGVLYVAHDTLVHQDAGQSRLSAFTTNGHFIATWPSPHMAEHDLAADTSGRIPVPASSGTMKLNSGHGVIRYRLNGAVADSLWYPSAPEPQVWRLKNANTDFGMLVPYAPDRVTLLDQGGRLIWGDQATGRFFYSINCRDTARIVEAEFTEVPLSDSLRQATFAAAVKRDSWLSGIAALGDIPRSYPLWTAMTADGANNLWLLRPGPRSEGDHWEVFDPDGRQLGAVPAPFDHADGTFWTRDHVYVLGSAADGTPAIEIYRIDRGTH